MDYKGAFKLIGELSGSKNTLAIHPAYCQMMSDSLAGGMFLAQCIYWTGKGNDPDGWFYKTYEEWSAECFLSKYDVKKFADLCAGLGFLETKTQKVGKTPKLHYRINESAFFAFATTFFSKSDFLNLESQKLESQILESQKIESPGLAKIGKSLESEKLESPIYTKTTTKTTDTKTTTPPSGGGDAGQSQSPLKRDRRTDRDYGHICTLVERNMGLVIVPITEKIINDWMDQYAVGVIEAAINIAVGAGKCFPAYVTGVLKKEAEKRDYSSKGRGRSTNYGPGSKTRYEIPAELADIIIG